MEIPRKQTTDRELISKSFRGHMENINHLVKEGKLIVAGPLGKNDKAYRGIFILNVTTFEEAESLIQNDSAIKKVYWASTCTRGMDQTPCLSIWIFQTEFGNKNLRKGKRLKGLYFKSNS